MLDGGVAGLGRGGVRAVLRRQRAEQGVRRIRRARQRARRASPPTSSTGCMRAGTDMVVLDSRPFDEYQRVSIPTAVNVPGAELVLRVRDLAPSPQTPGRGQLRRAHAQHHRRAVADQRRACPTRWWRCATAPWAGRSPGLPATAARRARAPAVSADGLAWAKSAAASVADRFGIARIDRATLERWRADGERTLYLLDVRDPGRIRGRPRCRRRLRARRTAGAGDRPVCRHARRAHRAGRRCRGARGHDRVLAAADGLERRVRAGRDRERDRMAGSARAGLGAGAPNCASTATASPR